MVPDAELTGKLFMLRKSDGMVLFLGELEADGGDTYYDYKNHSIKSSIARATGSATQSASTSMEKAWETSVGALKSGRLDLKQRCPIGSADSRAARVNPPTWAPRYCLLRLRVRAARGRGVNSTRLR